MFIFLFPCLNLYIRTCIKWTMVFRRNNTSQHEGYRTSIYVLVSWMMFSISMEDALASVSQRAIQFARN